MNNSKFARVKRYFDNGLWDSHKVADAVEKEWITAEEFEEITGAEYSAEEASENTAAHRLDEIEELIISIAEIEVNEGNLELEDIPSGLQDAVKIKIEDGKRLDK